MNNQELIYKESVKQCFQILHLESAVASARLLLTSRVAQILEIAPEQLGLLTDTILELLAVGMVVWYVGDDAELRVHSLAHAEHMPRAGRRGPRPPVDLRRRVCGVFSLSLPLSPSQPCSIANSLLRQHNMLLEMELRMLSTMRYRSMPLVMLERPAGGDSLSTDSRTYDVYRRHAEGYEADQVLGLVDGGAELIQTANALRVENLRLVREQARQINDRAARAGDERLRDSSGTLREPTFGYSFLGIGDTTSPADKVAVFPTPSDYRLSSVQPNVSQVPFESVLQFRRSFEETAQRSMGIFAQRSPSGSEADARREDAACVSETFARAYLSMRRQAFELYASYAGEGNAAGTAVDAAEK